MTKFSTVIISIALSSMTFAQEKPRENSLKVDMPAFLQASGALLINWPKAEKCAEVYPDLAQDLVNGIQKFALAKEKELSLVNSILEKYQGTGFLNEIQAKVRNDHRSRVEQVLLKNESQYLESCKKHIDDLKNGYVPPNNQKIFDSVFEQLGIN